MPNQRGFGLIEVMVSTAILSVLFAGMAQLTQYSLLQTQTFEAKNAVVSIVGTTTQLALNSDACTQAITQTSQPYSTDIRFDFPDSQTLSKNSTLKNYNLQVQSFKYIDSSLIDTGTDNTKIYYGTLMLELSSTRQVLGPKTFAPRVVAGVYLTVNPAGIIVACGAIKPKLVPAINPVIKDESAELEKTCHEIGGEWNSGACKFNNCNH